MAGRGAFTESFPLFGYNLQDYDELFGEKLDLLMLLRDNAKVTWSGKLLADNDTRLWVFNPVDADRQRSRGNTRLRRLGSGQQS